MAVSSRERAGRAAPPTGRRQPLPAVAGAVAALVALATSELLAGFVPGLPSLVDAVGGVVIDAVPAPVKDAAIALFGTADKVALVVGLLLVALSAGAALGLAAAGRFVVAVAGFGAFAALGALATLGDPRVSLAAGALSAAASAAAGLAALRVLLRRSGGGRTDSSAGRRGVLGLALLVGVSAATAGALGRRAVGRHAHVVAARDALVLPPPDIPLPPVPDGATLEIDRLTPYVTPNADFFRIDTALTVPRVDPLTWQMRVTGMVHREVVLTLDDLLTLEQVEADITLACVSNEVGGELVGNARWQGVRLADVLALAGVQDGATQLVGRAVDGFTVGFPTALALDGREALVAVGMNGAPLPVEHGFPARLVVPGLFGYVSATKWLAELELTTWEAFDAYWIPRGWAKEGPIKTQSRIDTPRGRVGAGRVAVAGVAWAPHRGIRSVEVRIDDGTWQQARLADEHDVDTWRQWVLEWEAEPGPHVLTVRATDAAGETQPQQRAPVAPDGATGWHSVRVTVV